MQFTSRQLTLDLALLVLAAVAWFYTDRDAVRDAILGAIASAFGFF
jgi:hypothetical protein